MKEEIKWLIRTVCVGVRSTDVAFRIPKVHTRSTDAKINAG